MNKIDLIIDALKNSEPNGLGWMQPHEDRHQAALAAARSLRELKPVAYINVSGYYYVQIPQGADPSYYTPLYALEVTK